MGCAKEGDSGRGVGLNRLASPAPAASAAKYPAKRNPEFSPDWKLTNEEAAASLNNFYEFFPNRATDLRKLTSKFTISPWPVQITGLVEKPMTLDADEIVANDAAGGACLPVPLRGSLGDDRAVDRFSAEQIDREGRGQARSEVPSVRDIQSSRQGSRHGADGELLSVAVLSRACAWMKRCTH